MGKKIDLTDAEWKVMELLWENSPRTITQLTAELKPQTGWTKGTVIKFLDRIQNKGGIRYDEGIKARQYVPCVSREEASLHETEGFLNKVYGGNFSLLVNTMAAGGKLKREEIDELFAMLKDAEEGEK